MKRIIIFFGLHRHDDGVQPCETEGSAGVGY